MVSENIIAVKFDYPTLFFPYEKTLVEQNNENE